MNVGTIRTVKRSYDHASARCFFSEVYSGIHSGKWNKRIGPQISTARQKYELEGEEWISDSEMQKIEQQHTPEIVKRMGRNS